MSRYFITMDKIPKSCIYCPCFEKYGSFNPARCGITKTIIEAYSVRNDDCPIREISELFSKKE